MQVELVERPIDNFVQVYIISPQVAAIVHSNYWQVALASIYVCISIHWASRKFLGRYMHIAHLPLSHGRARSKLYWQTLQHLSSLTRLNDTRSICVAREHGWLLVLHCEGRSLWDKVGIPAFTGVSGCRIDTKSKKNVFTHTHGRQKRYLAILAFLLYEQ